MAQLTQIRHRITSIEKTRTVTSAMRLIAMSLYSKLEKQHATLRAYESAHSRLMEQLKRHGFDIKSHLAPASDTTPERQLLIYIASNRSLCGSMNTALNKYISHTPPVKNLIPTDSITLGAHAKEMHTHHPHARVLLHEPEITYASIPALAQRIVELCIHPGTPYNSIVLYYTKLSSFFSQVPTHITLFPLEDVDTMSTTREETPDDQLIWEQKQDIIAPPLLTHYFLTKIMTALFNSIISENAARFIAMDQSTNNANTYLDLLQIEYNKSRQSAITQELAELSSSLE